MTNRKKSHYVNEVRDQVTHKNSTMSSKGSEDLHLVLHRSLKIQRIVTLAKCHLDNMASVKHMCQETKAQNVSRI